MSWRRLTALIGALSGDALWRHWRRTKPLEGEAQMSELHRIAVAMSTIE